MTPERTWVLIADAGQARILSREAPGGTLKPVEGMKFETELPPTRDLVSDKEPRSVESVGNMRHPISTGLDPHRKLKEDFAAKLADLLEVNCSKKSYEKLILVAPPQFLGNLRASLAQSVKNRIIMEVAKDFTKVPDHEIAERLAAVH
jgi:protein required for attachment to host cells